MDGTLLAGAARVVVTPALDVNRWGTRWGGRAALPPFREVHDDLCVRALVLERRPDGAGAAEAGERVAVVSCDAVGFPGRAFVDGVRRLVAAQTGIQGDHVLLAATHTHNTPWTLHLYDVEVDPHWVALWQGQIAGAVALAARRRRPARLAAGCGALHVAQNRRVLCADGKVYKNWQRPKPAPVLRDTPIDAALSVVVVQRADGPRAGQPLAVLANYTMHPVTAMSIPAYSADYPGVAMGIVERELGPGCVALFVNGAAGDVNPPEVRRNFADTAQVGRIVGGAVLQTAAALLGSPNAMPQGAPVAVPAPAEPGGGAIQAASALLHPPFREVDEDEAHATWERSRSLTYLRRYLVSVLEKEAEPLEVQVLRLGDLALVGVPGELFVEIGLAIKAASQAPLTAIAGYANDWQGYFPTPNAFDEGGYEVAPAPHSRYTVAAGTMIRDAAQRLLRQCWPRASR